MDYGKVFVDSSAWIANSSAKDRSHEKIASFLKEAIVSGAAFYTSNDVIDETITRLIYDLGLRSAKTFFVDFMDLVRKKIVVQFWTDEQIQKEAFEILNQFSDQKLSMTDATTVAIVKRFSLDGVLTLDDDFRKVGVRSYP